jgi:uncharacterized protein (TIGR02147 family)
MIDLVRQAVDGMDNTERCISGMTVVASRHCYDVLWAEIEAFKDRINTIVHNSAASDRVYQLNLQLFPVSRPMRKKSSEGEIA